MASTQMCRRRIAAVLLAAFVSTCAAQPERRKAVPGGRVVTPAVRSDSKSIVLRSTHILLIEVIGAPAGPWAPSRPGLKSRSVDLSLRVVETLRGRLDPEPAGAVRISITQYDYAGELMMQPLPGPWPRGDFMPGTAWVAFAHTEESRAERILVEPACTQVVPAAPVLAGLRIAAQAERGNLPLAQTLALAGPDTARLDPIFAGFLWGKYGDRAMASQPEFNARADFTERKGLQDRARQALVQGGYDLVKLKGDETPGRTHRLALTMFRVLLMPEAADLHENLIETYLPNLLGIASGLPHQEASAVFKGHESEREAVKAYLRRHGTDADAAPLLTWLNTR